MKIFEGKINKDLYYIIESLTIKSNLILRFKKERKKKAPGSMINWQLITERPN